MTKKIELLSETDSAYIAGFLDGDGSIFSQLVPRGDYRLKYQIKTTVNFTQSGTRAWFLGKLCKKIGCGLVRDRKDNCWEYSITIKDEVKALLETLIPFLVIKQQQAQLALHVINSLSKNQTVESFLQSCELVDKIATLNDSKNRLHTSETVRETLIKSSP